MIFHLQNASDLTILKAPGSLNGQPCLLASLTRCCIKLFDYSKSVKITDCKLSRIEIGPVSLTCEIMNCSNCTFSIACSEIQITSCSNLTLFIHSENEPEIRQCFGLKFAPYNIMFSGQEQSFAQAELNPYKDKWSEIRDFDRNDLESHYELLPPKQFVEHSTTFEGYGEPVNPVPRHIHYGGRLKYEIIPYSKTHRQTVERRELPPSNVVIHKENDSRKYVPFIVPGIKHEPQVSLRKEEPCKKIVLRYKYIKDHGFNTVSAAVPYNAKGLIDKTLKEFQVLLDRFFMERHEIKIATLFSIIACLLLGLCVELLRMTSEWLEIAWIGVFIIIVLSEVLISTTIIIKYCVNERMYLMLISEFNERKRADFDKIGAEFIGELESVEVYVNNVNNHES